MIFVTSGGEISPLEVTKISRIPKKISLYVCPNSHECIREVWFASGEHRQSAEKYGDLEL